MSDNNVQRADTAAVTAPTAGKKGDFPYIVGIGASAGGLEALQKLLTALPPDTGFPYIIVQHLSPDYKSLLGEILGKYTEMPVVQVEDGMEVQANRVHVIKPGFNLRISKGKLLLSALREKELNLPIDMFFRSLAEEAGARAIAIVLSGTGSDGSNGIKDVKEHDGLIMVQEQNSAKFDGMPRSALRTGLVDVQLAPEDIALELQHISTTASKEPYRQKTTKQIDDELMKKIYIILKKVSNVNFTHYKQTTILRRIERRMMLAHKETLAEYVDLLYESPEEVRTLSREVLIGVTSFFRDPEYFQCLKDKAIQSILIHSTEEEAIRVWVTGCSTGEEAYSIAILFSEVMDTLKIKRTLKIFATDLDMEAINTAGKGVYGDNIIDAVSPARLSRYFTRKNNTYIVNRDIRKMIVFSPHNVFQDPPFGRLDLISCRNMLIYFQPVLQNDLFALFHQALKDGGYLFLGKSEAIGAFTDAFPVVDAAAKIFSHRSEVKIPGTKAVPYLQTTFLDDGYDDEREDRYPRHGIPAPVPPEEQEKVDTAMLEQFMPASLVVNEKNNITRMYGDNSNYIHLPVGTFSNALFELLTEALKIPASTILKDARTQKGRVQYKNIAFRGEREDAVITMTATPVTKPVTGHEPQYALVFEDERSRLDAPEAVAFNIDRAASQRIIDLEQDLSDVQGRLNRSVADQECVNEELQAANEELLTANEELQSSNEELQSVNEELYTVNSEYQSKLTELAGLNDDIANFLSSSLTGIIFVDNKLNIRRYTDYVTTEFSVMDHDIGRSLKFISYHFPTVDIIEICENVLKTLIPDEREIITGKSKAYYMRVSPYRSTENKILGCVITFMDITKQRQGQVKLESTEKKLTVAQEEVEAKSGYLSRVAHEIRTPMSALRGLSRQIRQEADDPQKLSANLDKIDETVEYMVSIVTDISAASRAEREAMEQVIAPFALREVIDNVATLVGDRARDAGLAFEISMPDDFAPYYMGSVTALQQILINFLNNAIKYTPRGGAVALKVHEEIEPDAKEGIATLCLIVSDTGVGMDKTFIPRLFKPFTRERSGDPQESTSMGLGLSIAKRLIDAMNGTVDVESEVGTGSTFTIRLRLVRCEADDMDRGVTGGARVASLKGLNILVAEDNAVNRAVLCGVLTREGASVVEAADGEQAVRAFVEAPESTFDVILMDMRMPKMDGDKAAAAIRVSGKPDARSVPIVGVSANAFADDVRKAREAGVDGYTTKPINRDHLVETILALL